MKADVRLTALQHWIIIEMIRYISNHLYLNDVMRGVLCMSNITWESGTAFDLFVSLCVLTNPARYGLRPTWAAGVRSRLPLEDRTTLEKVQPWVLVPIAWLMNLDAKPKSAQAALAALEGLLPEERLSALTINPAVMAAEVVDILQGTERRGNWDTGEQAQIKAQYRKRNISLNPDQMESLMNAWREPRQFGERYLQALKNYYEVFFAEDEKHIQPVLSAGLAKAQTAAEDMPLEQLLETLSRGVQFTEYFQGGQSLEFVLAPSCWSSPLIFVNRLSEDRVGLVFGCREDKESLVPGEAVPPVLKARLKALADPTRLRILRYLAETPLPPSQLAKKLRLRPPTVVHHLNQLRLAGLVHIILLGEEKRCYAFRREGVEDTLESTLKFIAGDED